VDGQVAGYQPMSQKMSAVRTGLMKIVVSVELPGFARLNPVFVEPYAKIWMRLSPCNLTPGRQTTPAPRHSNMASMPAAPGIVHPSIPRRRLVPIDQDHAVGFRDHSDGCRSST
jgi:hypothetical protein